MESKNSVVTTGPVKNAKMVYNELMTRYTMLNRLLEGAKNIETECGHPQTVTTYDYDWAFSRGDVAARVVSIYPEETWSQDPEVFETENADLTPFEAAWQDLNIRLSLYSHLQRVDLLSGIGRFGILLLGFDDGGSLDRQVPEGEERQLLYLRPLDETIVEVKELEKTPSNPRYGLPVLYEVTFGNTEGTTISSQKQRVHWSRVIHVADNRTNSEVYGIPRMKRVYNRLLDLKKIAGGAGEMFWKGGFPGLSMQSHPNITEDVDFDKEDTKEQMEAYMKGLQRYLLSIGMDVKSLEVQVADPRPHVEVQLKLIATALGVPWRIFVGSEAAHLASDQDVGTWNRRLTQRRRNYVNPYIVRPFVDRLIQYQVLPTPKMYQVWWPDLNTPSDEQRAQNAERGANALSKYVQSGASELMPPFYFLTVVMGLEDDEAEAVIRAALVEQKDPLLEIEEPEPAATGRNGSGNPARNVALPQVQ